MTLKVLQMKSSKFWVTLPPHWVNLEAPSPVLPEVHHLLREPKQPDDHHDQHLDLKGQHLDPDHPLKRTEIHQVMKEMFPSCNVFAFLCSFLNMGFFVFLYFFGSLSGFSGFCIGLPFLN